MSMHDDIKTVLVSEEQLKAKVAELGAQISRDYAGKNLVLVSILKGSVVFMADLMRAVSIPCNIDFMVVSSYGGSNTTTAPEYVDVYKQDGTLLFRPAGHGALVENLNEIDADLVFIKNIDNVTTDARRGDTIRYKKVLAGILLDLQDRAFEYLKALEVGGAELEPIVEAYHEYKRVSQEIEDARAMLAAGADGLVAGLGAACSVEFR